MKHHAMKSPTRASSSSSSSSSLSPAAMGATHKFSHAIAKPAPRKIRIVHVLAPEVIKTDARHFRELVQQLTGMPAGDEGAEAAVAIKAEVKVEEAETAAAASGGFLYALGEEDGNDMLLQFLDGGFCMDDV